MPRTLRSTQLQQVNPNATLVMQKSYSGLRMQLPLRLLSPTFVILPPFSIFRFLFCRPSILFDRPLEHQASI